MWNASYSPDKPEERNTKGVASLLLPLETAPCLLRKITPRTVEIFDLTRTGCYFVQLSKMGRSPIAMNNESSSVVNTEDMTIKEEVYDVKLEDVSLSVSTEVLQTNSIPKMKPTRMLFSHLPSVKEDALSTFTEIQESIYQDEELGESSQQVDVMSCECKPAISGIPLLQHFLTT